MAILPKNHKKIHIFNLFDHRRYRNPRAPAARLSPTLPLPSAMYCPRAPRAVRGAQALGHRSRVLGMGHLGGSGSLGQFLRTKRMGL